jgi:predicted acetyltransferase
MVLQFLQIGYNLRNWEYHKGAAENVVDVLLIF